MAIHNPLVAGSSPTSATSRQPIILGYGDEQLAESPTTGRKPNEGKEKTMADNEPQDQPRPQQFTQVAKRCSSS